MSDELYENLMKTIKYDYSKNQKDFSDFINELPYLLKSDLTWKIHEHLPLNINFFRNKDRNFICWVGPLLKLVKCYELEYIYKQDDQINEIYFMQSGLAGFVIPKYDNIVYIKIEKGNHFGLSDIQLAHQYMSNSE